LIVDWFRGREEKDPKKGMAETRAALERSRSWNGVRKKEELRIVMLEKSEE